MVDGVQVSFDLGSVFAPITAPVATIFGPAARELGEMLGDKMRAYRFANLANVLDKVERIATERNIPVEHMKALPFGDAVRVVEAASMEEDDTVQEMWARLLANAVDPAIDVTINKTLVQLLESLSSAEVLLLELLRWIDIQNRLFSSRADIKAFDAECSQRAAAWRALARPIQGVAEQNLLRLRCIAQTPSLPKPAKLIEARPTRSHSLSGVSRDVELRTDGLVEILDAMLRRQMEGAGIETGGARGGLPVRSPAGLGYEIGEITSFEAHWMLTALGQSLIRATANPSA